MNEMTIKTVEEISDKEPPKKMKTPDDYTGCGTLMYVEFENTDNRERHV